MMLRMFVIMWRRIPHYAVVRTRGEQVGCAVVPLNDLRSAVIDKKRTLIRQ